MAEPQQGSPAGGTPGDKAGQAASGASSRQPMPPVNLPEQDVWRGTPSALAGLDKLALAVAISVGLILLAWFLKWHWLALANWVVIALLLLWAVAGDLYAKLANQYRLTTQRLFIRHGLLRQTTDQTELIRVDDVRVTRGLLQRIVGLGNVIVVSTDASNAESVLKDVADPHRIAELVRENTRKLRQSSLFIERL